MSRFLQINLRDYNLASDFIKIENCQESACIGCLKRQGDFTYVYRCSHADFLQDLIKNKENYHLFLLCSMCHKFAKKVHNFHKQVQGNLTIMEDEGPSINTVAKYNELSIRNLPSLYLSGESKPKISSENSCSVPCTEKSALNLGNSDQNNIPCTQTSFSQINMATRSSPIKSEALFTEKGLSTNQNPASLQLADESASDSSLANQRRSAIKTRSSTNKSEAPFTQKVLSTNENLSSLQSTNKTTSDNTLANQTQSTKRTRLSTNQSEAPFTVKGLSANQNSASLQLTNESSSDSILANETQSAKRTRFSTNPIQDLQSITQKYLPTNENSSSKSSSSPNRSPTSFPTNQTQAPSFQLSNSFLKGLLDTKQNVGRLFMFDHRDTDEYNDQSIYEEMTVNKNESLNTCTHEKKPLITHTDISTDQVGLSDTQTKVSTNQIVISDTNTCISANQSMSEVRMEDVEQKELKSEKDSDSESESFTFEDKKKGKETPRLRQNTTTVTALQASADQSNKFVRSHYKRLLPHQLTKITEVMLTKEQMLAERDVARDKPEYKAGKYRCETCIQVYHTPEALKWHMNKVHKANETGPFAFTCDICSAVANRSVNAKNHYQKHFKRFVCKQCGYRNPNPRSLLSHIEKEHSADTGVVYECNVCSFTTNLYAKITTHKLKAHRKSLRTCELCNTEFPERAALLKHIRTSHPDKSKWHNCPQCARSFPLRDMLRSHVRLSHSDYSRYCQKCDKYFRNNHQLKAHEKSKQHSGGADELRDCFDCDYCGKRYYQKARLVDHIRLEHLKIVDFKCHICSKVYPRENSLKRHVAFVHEKKSLPRNYVCQYCGNGFTSRAILESHIRRHTGERPLQCAHCDARFAHKAALYNHTKLVHKRRDKVS